jgi:predicted ATP-binding protein involved in virulence
MNSEQAPTRIDKIELENFRCFPKLVVEFDKKLTVLVAPNGGGKTALLEGVSIALRLFVDTLLTKQGSSGFAHADIRLQLSAERTMEAILPTCFNASGAIGGKSLQWSRQIDSDRHRAKTTLTRAAELKTAALELRKHLQEYTEKQRADSPLLPLVAYYGTGRLFGAHKLTQKRQHKGASHTSRTNGYDECLSSSSRYKFFLDWFERFSKELQQELSTGIPSPHQPGQRLKAVKAAVDAVLKPTQWEGLVWDFVENMLAATHPSHGTLPVDWLSDGIRNTLGLVADIAHRCVRLNPQFGERAALETHGIILIDEIDMHLHPEWQQLVLPALSEAFPCMQFIVTTHSPQVLSTVRKENVRILEKDSEAGWCVRTPEHSPLSQESGDVLATVMGVNPIPIASELQSDLLETVHDYEQLICAGMEGQTPALAVKAKLEAAGYEIPEAKLARWRFIGEKIKLRS